MSTIPYKYFGFCQKWNAFNPPRILGEGLKAQWRDGEEGKGYMMEAVAAAEKGGDV